MKKKKSKHKTLEEKLFLLSIQQYLGQLNYILLYKAALQYPDMIIQLNFLNKYHKQNSCSDVPTQF